MTEDGFPEVYPVLRSRVDAQQRVWLQIRIPGRPNGRTGWVLEQRLGSLRTVDTFLHIRRGRDARLYRGNRIIWRAPVGTGAAATPTPAGRFWIREKFRANGGIYGPYAIGTAAYSVLSEWPRGGVIGIHGTNQPWLIPGRPSHGCIRVRNAQIATLYRILPIGTPLLIS
jgi:lipoprotein-anchoring transpeptidase ErfK/SrfK